MPNQRFPLPPLRSHRPRHLTLARSRDPSAKPDDQQGGKPNCPPLRLAFRNRPRGLMLTSVRRSTNRRIAQMERGHCSIDTNVLISAAPLADSLGAKPFPRHFSYKLTLRLPICIDPT